LPAEELVEQPAVAGLVGRARGCQGVEVTDDDAQLAVPHGSVPLGWRHFPIKAAGGGGSSSFFRESAGGRAPPARRPSQGQDKTLAWAAGWGSEPPARRGRGRAAHGPFFRLTIGSLAFSSGRAAVRSPSSTAAPGRAVKSWARPSPRTMRY